MSKKDAAPTIDDDVATPLRSWKGRAEIRAATAVDALAIYCADLTHPSPEVASLTWQAIDEDSFTATDSQGRTWTAEVDQVTRRDWKVNVQGYPN